MLPAWTGLPVLGAPTDTSSGFRCSNGHKSNANDVQPIERMSASRGVARCAFGCRKSSRCMHPDGDLITCRFYSRARLVVQHLPPTDRALQQSADSLAISNRLSRYRSVPRRPPPEGNLWRDPGPGHGTRYGPPPVRPSSHSALLGKPPPVEAHRCIRGLPSAIVPRPRLVRGFDEPGSRVFLCPSPCVP